MKRTAQAEWSGKLKTGTGTLGTGSGVLKAIPYNFAKRFADEPGTNPEELIGAAHSGCFSMALSGELEKAGIVADAINTTATVSFEPDPNGGFHVSAIHLDTHISAAGADEAAALKAAADAKVGCPISKLLSPGVAITMNAKVN